VALALTLLAALVERLVEPETYPSLWDAVWWALVTVSTTGYGDVVPHTVPGKIVASIVMINALALIPAITAVVTALLVRRHEEDLREPAAPVRERVVDLEEVIERLDRLERLLARDEDEVLRR
jgi:voltage-gated potassium channel Kch